MNENKYWLGPAELLEFLFVTDYSCRKNDISFYEYGLLYVIISLLYIDQTSMNNFIKWEPIPQ